jgi:hypothetical protein
MPDPIVSMFTLPNGNPTSVNMAFVTRSRQLRTKPSSTFSTAAVKSSWRAMTRSAKYQPPSGGGGMMIQPEPTPLKSLLIRLILLVLVVVIIWPLVNTVTQS